MSDGDFKANEAGNVGCKRAQYRKLGEVKMKWKSSLGGRRCSDKGRMLKHTSFFSKVALAL